MKDVKTNQLLEIEQKNTVQVASNTDKPDGLFENISASSGLDFVHTENDFDDYEKEILFFIVELKGLAAFEKFDKS